MKEGIAQYQQQQKDQPQVSSDAKTPPKPDEITPTKSANITPPRRAKNTPRMTSSPIRRTPLRKAVLAVRTEENAVTSRPSGGCIGKLDERDEILKDVINNKETGIF